MTRRIARRTSPQDTYVPLRRADLAGFDRQAKELILDAIARGCLGRISSKGHVILRNGAGDTTALPRSLHSTNRSSQNARSDMRRFLRAHEAHRADTGAQTKEPRS